MEPKLEIKVPLTSAITIEVGEEYRLNDLLNKKFNLNGFHGQLEGHLFLEDIDELPGILPWHKQEYESPLQFDYHNTISYINDLGNNWNILYPIGVPICEGKVRDLSALSDQFKCLNGIIYILNPAPELIITAQEDARTIHDKEIYFPLGIELSVNGKKYSSGGRIRKSEENASAYYVHYKENWGGVRNRTFVYLPKNQSLENMVVKFSKIPKSSISKMQESRHF